ncbi:hypothetical protein JXC34_05520 [Candidatus Woesearchaeota archaeon]|nr:hypothetical protein [Candidatus Woesearchaeota archaeon]
MNEYYSSMDRELGQSSSEIKEVDRAADVGIDEWGTTTNPFEHQTQALKARIFHGASKIEFAFFGAGKGRKEQATPGTFGRRDRMDMRELAEFNEVETTTHATVGVTGLSGLDMRQNMFDDRQRKEAIDEIKRAVHFASEATTGGAIVFHTGEAPRSMISRFKEGDVEFEMFPEEEIREMHFLADPVTKRLVGPLRENDRIVVPKIKLKNGKPIYLKDENGKDVQDDLLKEYDDLDKGKIPVYEYDDEGNIQTEVINFKEWKQRRIKEYEEKLGRDPNEEEIVRDFYQKQIMLQVQYSLYFGKGQEDEYRKSIENREKILKALEFYKELKEKVPEKDWWKFEREKPSIPRHYDYHGMIPSDKQDPVEYLTGVLRDIDRHISYARELAVSGRRQAREQLEMVRRTKLAHDFAVEESAKSMGELGVYTWQMSEKAKKEGQGEGGRMKLKHDLYLAPENLFPETYGSHPDELRRIVVEGRKSMAKKLMSTYGKSEKEADEIAKTTIRATLDIGHANIWRKYFKSKEGESQESRDKRFNEWLLKKTKKLVDDGIVGHIHISDNFGFHDEHLTAGDGNAPIKDFVKQAKEAGLKEFIVESGSFNPLTSLPDTWMHFDSPVYGIHVPGFTPDSWTDPSIGQSRAGWNNFYRSYFGRTEGPRYIVGEYAPSEEFKGAPFYTGLGME